MQRMKQKNTYVWSSELIIIIIIIIIYVNIDAVNIRNIIKYIIEHISLFDATRLDSCKQTFC